MDVRRFVPTRARQTNWPIRARCGANPMGSRASLTRLAPRVTIR